MSFVKTATRRVSTAGQLLGFFVNRKRWWMLPMIILLVLTGVLLVLAQSSAIAPFIYTMF